MKHQPIYTENTNCQDCYKCIRNCDVKAIKIKSHKASVIDDLCIACGKCIDVCPANAKKMRNDISYVKMLLAQGKKIIVSLAPSYLSEFNGISKSKMISNLKKMGFHSVSETAIGAEITTSKVREWLKEKTSGVFYSSCCPVVVELICKYYPNLKEKISPFSSPVIAHAEFLKKQIDSDTEIIFIGPCVGKKKEIDKYPELLSASLSFKELREWAKEEGLDFEPDNQDYKKEEFYPFEAKNGSVYPIDGGMIDGLSKGIEALSTNMMSFSGLDEIREILDNAENFDTDKALFLELMACKGGCVNSYSSSTKGAIAQKRIKIISDNKINKEQGSSIKQEDAKEIHIKNKFLQEGIEKIKSLEYSEEQIHDALKYIGKLSDEDCLNCGGCGYQSCRNFVIALLEGKAERNMCVSYMRNVAQNKATVLLQKMPYGVVIVDDRLEIVESNLNFAKMMGEDVERIFQLKPGLEGADMKKLFPFHKYFSNLIHSGEDEVQKDIRFGDKLYSLSIFTLQPKRLVCGIIHNLKMPELRREEVIKRSQKVIRKNLETVQKIAFLMGENASETESILNSIVESYKD
ncbi:MAG: 4Fe-4S binding protein [Marinifilaceae bacterium]|jgi:iron only hydrogenase large subunit-like protein|nr:4Fe-4S binding protein [Marinifilaceae bacterium]